MNVEIINRYKALLIFALAVLVGGFLFFYHLYQQDMGRLKDFVASYETFNKVISDFSTSGINDLESKANLALSELTAKADISVSSLIKNDKLIPLATREVADLAEKELTSLKVHQQAIQSKGADMGILSKEFSDLATERRAAYARFQKLGK